MKQKILLLIAVVILVLVVLLLTFPQSRNTIGRFYTYLTAPSEVKNMIFVVGEEGNASLVRIYAGGLHTFSRDGISVLEAVKHGERIFAILEEQATGAIDVYGISFRTGEQRALTGDGQYKEGLSISPDGTMLAYALVGPPLDGKPDIYYDVRRHRIVTLNLSSGEVVDIEPGAHPFFLDDSTLFFTNQDGYKVQSLSGPEQSTLTGTSSANTIIFRPSVSRTGYIAYRNVRIPSDFLILKIANWYPLSLLYNSTVSAREGSILDDVAFADSIAYSVYTTRGETTIHTFNPASSSNEERVLFTFPEAIDIMNLIAQ